MDQECKKKFAIIFTKVFIAVRPKRKLCVLQVT